MFRSGLYIYVSYRLLCFATIYYILNRLCINIIIDKSHIQACQYGHVLFLKAHMELILEANSSTHKFWHHIWMHANDQCRSLTNATKNRTTTFEDLIAVACIQVFLTAMRSAKWLVADSTPTKSWILLLGVGWVFHLSENSNTRWGEKLGWEVGRDVA